jgi:hypothetical protein
MVVWWRSGQSTTVVIKERRTTKIGCLLSVSYFFGFGLCPSFPKTAHDAEVDSASDSNHSRPAHIRKASFLTFVKQLVYLK